MEFVCSLGVSFYYFIRCEWFSWQSIDFIEVFEVNLIYLFFLIMKLLKYFLKFFIFKWKILLFTRIQKNNIFLKVLKCVNTNIRKPFINNKNVVFRLEL